MQEVYLESGIVQIFELMYQVIIKVLRYDNGDRELDDREKMVFGDKKI